MLVSYHKVVSPCLYYMYGIVFLLINNVLMFYWVAAWPSGWAQDL